MKFLIYSCCKIVRGAKNSVIYDFQRSTLRFIPVELARILRKFERKDLNTVKENFHYDEWEILHSSLKTLEKEEYIFFTNDVDSYLDLESSWDAPNRITNGIIDIDPNIKNDFSNLWKMLEDVHCEYIQIRIYQSISLTLLRTILSSISNRRIISIELLIKDNFEYGRDELLSLISDYPRILYLWLHSSRKNECVYTPNKDSEFGYIIRSKEKYDNSGCCGNVSAS